MVERFAEEPHKPSVIICDNDTKLPKPFQKAFEDGGIGIHRITFRCPNLNAYAERFVQSIKQECLDKMLVFGEKHLSYIVSEYVDYYNTERPHQGRDNRPPVREEVPEYRQPGVIECRERLGGLLKHYRRAA